MPWLPVCPLLLSGTARGALSRALPLYRHPRAVPRSSPVCTARSGVCTVPSHGCGGKTPQNPKGGTGEAPTAVPAADAPLSRYRGREPPLPCRWRGRARPAPFPCPPRSRPRPSSALPAALGARRWRLGGAGGAPWPARSIAPGRRAARRGAERGPAPAAPAAPRRWGYERGTMMIDSQVSARGTAASVLLGLPRVGAALPGSVPCGALGAAHACPRP